MPRGAVANVLVTSCSDNICRIWSETILPEDGIISMSQLDPNAAQDTKYRTHRQKARFVQRFRHLRQSFAARKVVRESANNIKPDPGQDPVAALPSTYSVHEFHNYGFQGTGISPGLHFHLSGTINALTDIPLVPSLTGRPKGAQGDQGSSAKTKHNFVLHWLNNKEMEFTVQAEKIMEDLLKMALERDDITDEAFEYELTHPDRNLAANDESLSEAKKSKTHLSVQDNVSHGSQSSLALSEAQAASVSAAPGTANISLNLSDTLDHRIESVLKEWHQNSDLLFAIHPIDGSLLVWMADFLDEYQPGSFRQAQISFSSRIPNALPIGDAMTMGSGVAIYNSGSINFRDMFKNYEKKLVKNDDIDNGNIDEDGTEQATEAVPDDKVKQPEEKKPTAKKSAKYSLTPSVNMISKHSNVMFADKSKFSTLLNISHKSRASGHRFRVNDIACHPVLPLMLTTSHHNVVHAQNDVSNKGMNC